MLQHRFPKAQIDIGVHKYICVWMHMQIEADRAKLAKSHIGQSFRKWPRNELSHHGYWSGRAELDRIGSPHPHSELPHRVGLRWWASSAQIARALAPVSHPCLRPSGWAPSHLGT
jgi:hypothetical protein